MDGEKRVIDHNHFTGKYFGIAHSICNLKRRSRAEMVVFLHNANYDFVELLPGLLGKKFLPNDVKGIPKAIEKFMSLTLEIKMGEEVHQKKSGGKKVKKILF